MSPWQRAQSFPGAAGGVGGARAEVQVGSHLGALVWSQTLGVSRVLWPGVQCFSLGAEGGVCWRGLFSSFFFSFLITQVSKD